MIKIKFIKPEGPKKPKIYWVYFWGGMFCTVTIPYFIQHQYGESWEVQIIGMAIWFFLLMAALMGMEKNNRRKK